MVAAREDDVSSLERDLHVILAVEPDNADALTAGYTLADLTDRYEESAKARRALELKPDEHYVVDSMGGVVPFETPEKLKYLRQALSSG